MMDDVDAISKGQHYLQIVLEQLEKSNDEANVRIELLVSTYLSLADNVLEDLKHDFKKLRRHCNKDFDLSNK
jgi:UDP-N-acetylglucosamine pyrophosphorylase